jgi:hypothetical protein
MVRIGCGLAMLLMMAAVDIASAQGRRHGDSPARGYQEHDRMTGTTFTVSTNAEGNAVVTLKGGDFSLEKVVTPTGDATLRLTQGKDVVTIALNQAGIQIGRGRRTVRLDPRADKGEGFDAVRALLTGSQPVRSFKRLAASLENRDDTEEDGALALVALVDGALVQLLEGDVDAPNRITRRITRKQRAAFRPAAVKRAPDYFRDCVGMYQVALLDSYTEWQRCWIDAWDYSVWTRSLIFKLCEWEWALRSQQYVWQFVGCFTLPI